MGKYNFKLTFHGDVILDLSGNCYNFGYDYLPRLPFVPWLHNLQVSGKNIFKDLRIPPAESKLDRDLSDLTDEAISMSRKLPVSLADFNLGLKSIGVADFYSGSNQVGYSWRLEKNGALYLFQQGGEIMRLFPGDSREFIAECLDFVTREEKLGQHRGQVFNVVQRLKES